MAIRMPSAPRTYPTDPTLCPIVRVETRTLYGQTVTVRVLAPAPVLGVVTVVHIEHALSGQGRIGRRLHPGD